MTPTEINIAIAEELGLPKTTECLNCDGTGFTGSELDHDPCARCKTTGKVEPHFTRLPNFHGSLDACVQFEAALNEQGYWLEYVHTLACVVDPEHNNEFHTTLKWTTVWPIATATAPQRCEAFLRLRGKWKD